MTTRRLLPPRRHAETFLVHAFNTRSPFAVTIGFYDRKGTDWINQAGGK